MSFLTPHVHSCLLSCVQAYVVIFQMSRSSLDARWSWVGCVTVVGAAVTGDVAVVIGGANTTVRPQKPPCPQGGRCYEAPAMAPMMCPQEVGLTTG